MPNRTGRHCADTAAAAEGSVRAMPRDTVDISSFLPVNILYSMSLYPKHIVHSLQL